MQMINFDKSARYIYNHSFPPLCGVRFVPANALCRNCDEMLEIYYCEGRTYAVRCPSCSQVTLVLATSPRHAAEQVGNV